ncbi:unnamed protein product [Coffea canephora]|uniref:DUF3511 domain-containing protein n=1 Tax=Coffea canephora TaxID=49390 RepID=A0A068VBP5_COFCA|nr:unnamed protein product [Coffea canephora]
MTEFEASHRRTAGQTLEIINGKAYGANNVCVTRSNNHFANQAGRYQVTEPTSTPAPPPPPPTSSSRSWIDYRQLNRRKRIATYKYYAYEGKVKNSIKKGFRWIKRTCRKIVHGY